RHVSAKRVFGAVVTVAVLVLAAVVPLTTQPFAGAERSGPEVIVVPARLEATVRKLAVDFHPRGHQNPEKLDAAAAWLKAQLGPGATEQTWKVEGREYRNVSRLYGPATGDRVVVGAHYDTCEGLPGADDNASGVAGALELAHVFAVTPPPGPVEIVFWSLEEPPFFRTREMGSVVHADALAAAGARVKAALSLETIGYFSDAPGSQHFPIGALGLIYPTTANHIAVVGNLGQVGLTRKVKRAMSGANDLPVASINAAAAIPGIDWSDHRSYWAHGWPAVMVTDTALNRNANYHHATDTPETLDYVRMAKVVAQVHSAVWALSAQK
ncbi:MAG: M28 family peptidase, partial [Myxococcaceae bacterium]|nr:M28 family peptidase [Myxococcaceae bacterium]